MADLIPKILLHHVTFKENRKSGSLYPGRPINATFPVVSRLISDYAKQ